eukprot:3548629-Alexandrium_andersonii.AAC.1
MFEPSTIQHLEPRRACTHPVHNPRGLDISFWAHTRDPAADRLVSHRISGPTSSATATIPR